MFDEEDYYKDAYIDGLNNDSPPRMNFDEPVEISNQKMKGYLAGQRTRDFIFKLHEDEEWVANASLYGFTSGLRGIKPQSFLVFFDEKKQEKYERILENSYLGGLRTRFRY